MTEFSHFTHPDLSLKEAVKRSCAFPIIFKPVLDGSNCYIDGGVFANLPLNYCLNRVDVKEHDKILALYTNGVQYGNKISNDSGLFSYILSIIRTLIDTQIQLVNIKHHICYDLIDLINTEKEEPVENNKSVEVFYVWKLVATSKEFRQRCFKYGVDSSKKFIKSVLEIE